MNDIANYKPREIMEKKYAKQTLDDFLHLPRRAQEVVWAVANCHETSFLIDVIGINIDGCKSPIEQILSLALDYRIESYMNSGDLKFVWTDSGSLDSYYICPTPQLEVFGASGKKYFADFSIEIDNFITDVDLKLLVECDGHDFHEKTKAQVSRDNERAMDLRLAGYEILRFSGSQIYSDPFKCADEVCKYVVIKMNEIIGDTRKQLEEDRLIASEKI